MNYLAGVVFKWTHFQVNCLRGLAPFDIAVQQQLLYIIARAVHKVHHAIFGQF